MSVALRALVVLTVVSASGCTAPVEAGPTGVPLESKTTVEPTQRVTERIPLEDATSPEPRRTTEPFPVEPKQPAAPVLIYECAPPTAPVFDDLLGPGFLFDPQAMVSFSGAAARVTVVIDGFTAQEVSLSQDIAVPEVLQPIDLTRTFFDTRTDEDRYNGMRGTTRHHAVAALTDDAGQTVTSECTFNVSFP